MTRGMVLIKRYCYWWVLGEELKLKVFRERAFISKKENPGLKYFKPRLILKSLKKAN